MTDIQPELPNTAISTWSGFVYQGKVALVHCLKLISEQFDSVKFYKLQLESIDDFAILSNTGECRSMHQVKANKETYFSKYHSAILKQQKACTNYPQATVYFHVSRAIRDLPSDFSNQFSPVQLYKYNKDGEINNFCGLDEINGHIEKLIQSIYQQHYTDSIYKNSGRYLKWSRNFLENLIVDKVIDIHHKIQKSKGSVERKLADCEIILFDQFFQILDMDLNEDLLTEDYYFYHLRKHTGNYFKDYCDDIDGDEDCDFGKLDCYMSHIISLDKDKFRKFICSILPHKKGNFSHLTAFKDNTFNGEDLKNGLFYVLNQLVESQVDVQGLHPSIFYWQKELCNYYPTAIRDSEQHMKKFCTKIIDSSMDGDLDFLYESGNLVTVSMNCESIFEVIGAGPHANYEEDESYHKRINNFKHVSLISVDRAREILND